MSGLDVEPAVAIASDQSLVAEAVAAALEGSNLAVVRNEWPGADQVTPPGWSRDPAPFVGLLLCDLEMSATRTARCFVRAYPTQWLLLTNRPAGPLWGAMLEAGVVGILPNTTTLADLLLAIDATRSGRPCGETFDRDELVRAWRRHDAEREDVHLRMSSLTAREAQVLQELHRGRTVHEMAGRQGVAHSTVRTQVRSVLRKLGVTSQLAAVAMFEHWGAGEPLNEHGSATAVPPRTWPAGR